MPTDSCANCKYENLPGTSRCQRCGFVLDNQALIIPQNRPVVLSKRQLPARQLKILGVPVAVAAVTLLAEAGLILLRRRVPGDPRSLLPFLRKRSLPAKVQTRIENKNAAGRRVVTIYSERVVEERRWGRPMRRIVDRLAWRSEETIES